MTNKILCAVDGSEHSMRAVTKAAELSRAGDTQIILILVDQVFFEPRMAPVHALGEAKAESILKAADEAARKAGAVNVSTVVVASRDVGRAILNYAEEHHIDHIVVGTGEKSAGTRLVLGSVSHDLIARAHCTVTVAR